MNGLAAQGMVVGCLAASGAIAVGNAITEGHAPTFKQLIGFGAASLMLATLAIPAPDLAAGFSVLVLTSAVFVYAGPLLDSLASVTTSVSSAASATKPATVNA